VYDPAGSPFVRLYAAVTPSLAMKPDSVPLRAGSAAPYVFEATFGVTEAVALLIVNTAVL